MTHLVHNWLIGHLGRQEVKDRMDVAHTVSRSVARAISVEPERAGQRHDKLTICELGTIMRMLDKRVKRVIAARKGNAV